MKKTRKQYTKEFKTQIVELVEAEESAQELHLGSIRETVGRGVAGAAASYHRNRDDE